VGSQPATSRIGRSVLSFDGLVTTGSGTLWSVGSRNPNGTTNWQTLTAGTSDRRQAGRGSSGPLGSPERAEPPPGPPSASAACGPAGPDTQNAGPGRDPPRSPGHGRVSPRG